MQFGLALAAVLALTSCRGCKGEVITTSVELMEDDAGNWHEVPGSRQVLPPLDHD